jgi:glycosyltransferase involved in cell wall biosynthesis
MHYIFWQNEVSLHQSACLRAVAARGHRCSWVVEHLIESHRRALGCGVPDVQGLDVIVAPDEGAMRSLLEEAGETVHVLSGLGGVRTVDFAWQYCRRRPRPLGVLSEGADAHGWKGLVRRALYRWAGLRHGAQPDFVLAMGERGVRWYTQAGFPPERLFPFAYVTEPAARCEAGSVRTDRRFRMLYLGSLWAGKAPDRLVEAVTHLPRHDWSLRVVGDGPLRATLEGRVRAAGLENQVEFRGVLPHGEAMRVLAECDLLVLPSRHDGWGAVVNEALMRGVPVLCSDRCGAADLLREAWRGEVYPYGDEDALVRALMRWIAAGSPDEAQRSRIRDWARCLEGPVIADYFLAVTDHVYRGGSRPIAPWRRSCEASGS